MSVISWYIAESLIEWLNFIRDLSFLGTIPIL